MGTSKEQIRGWLARGKAKKATHMLVVVDTFEYEDYPVYIMPGEKIHTAISVYSTNMQRVMECYSYSLDLESQLNENRAYHLEGGK